MSACDHPLDGHTNHGPWCEGGAAVAERQVLTPVTRIVALPRDTSPRAEFPLLHEWSGYLPVVPEGSLLQVGEKVWRVRYRTVCVNEAAGEAVLIYTVQDAREKPRL